MEDVEAELPGGQGPVVGGAIAPGHGVGAARRVLVGQVGEGEGLEEVLSLEDRDVGPGVHHQHLGWRGDGDALAARIGPGAVLVHQRGADGARPGGGVGVGHLAAGRQGRGADDLHRRAVTPVDAVLADRVGPRVGHGPQGQGVDQVLLDRAHAVERHRRRHVVDRHVEAVQRHAVGLALLVVDGDVDGVAAVVGVGVRDVGVGRVAGKHRVGGAVAPVDGDQPRLGVRVGNREGADERRPFRAVAGGPGLHLRPVVHVGQVDDREHRLRGERDAVRPRPAELVGAEVVQVALIRQFPGLQLLEADLLVR